MSVILPREFTRLCPPPLSEFSYNGVSISWYGNNSSIDWSDDGKYLYAGTKRDRTVFTYTVPTPFVITGATTGTDERYGFISDGSIGSGDDVWGTVVTKNAAGVEGRAMFLSLQGSLAYGPLFQYDLSNAWKPWRSPTYPGYTTFVGQYDLQDDTGANNNYNLQMSPDGTKIIVIAGTSPSSLHQWTLSTPFTISSISYDGSTSLVTSDFRFDCLSIPPSGRCIYLYNTATDSIEQYTFDTPWDISTFNSTLVSSLDTSAELTRAQAIYVGFEHVYAFTVQTSPTTGTLYQYDL